MNTTHVSRRKTAQMAGRTISIQLHQTKTEETMKDKPPTTESLNTARKIAERMREARQYPAALPALPAQTDYERGFTDGHETGYQAGLRKAAEAL